MRAYLLLAAALVAAPVLSSGGDSSSLPTVTLDYSTIQAVGGNTTVGYYKFQDIRYAKAPIGDLRFAAPQWPDVETEINTGNLADTNVDCASWEDCLFMDVWAPADAVGRNLPVLVYNYGGRFKLGSKSVSTPEGLFELSTDFIFVSYNYRLGITGVVTGPTYQHEGGVSNLVVWDATHAFEWVQRYICNFGGNPSDVTAVGFSAGGSQIGFQMTRFGGNAPQLFHKAFIMSPGYVPAAGHHQAEQFWQNVSTAVGCDGGHLTCMREVPFDTLANATVSIVNAYSYTLQPRADGFILPNTVAYDGVETEEDVSAALRVFLPGITDDAIEDALELYPAENYASAGLRFSDIRQSYEITAKKYALTRALNNQTWNGEVGISPAKHGTDQNYYFYGTYKLSASSNDTTTTNTAFKAAEAALSVAITSPVDPTIARQMQKYLLSFVLTGNPNSVWADDKPYWPRYNESVAGVQIVMNDTFSIADDYLAGSKSLFWNKALWY
ncbi:hypothetical protein PF005_g11905 [Phytophthora fragariae]|uniref:Carboxylesterase type B domain-containing protein n=1 Tax=Phytophthora fragariae TaxID=53985 RepID=A0A6A4C2Q1_9STRA|nr:hypothetical protein PF003_g7728 [Phytophthora fragariae]KAE8925362.1 hypothetical protein PF009_g24428 [Phytophthora fragariae]KAE8978976.1 hypothetical protein PF011_g23030 [Phytophthora fragariae]KAE9078829.1 hypothetical protein PF007_g23691 [Phytophthora fragariae]KAE9097649.1 hypothetical protein PF006_g23527 [Phytophthora fragariae]